MKLCKNLEMAPSNEFKSDIGNELFAEFSIIVSTILKIERITHVLNLLNAVIKHGEFCAKFLKCITHFVVKASTSIKGRTNLLKTQNHQKL